jgi:TRAP-type C4-dicarboxylate transport system permease small subunit
VDRIWSWIERLTGTVALLALACLVGLPFLQVILRDFFSSPIVGLEEATRWGLITLVYCALPLLVVRDGQIRFAELIDRLPRAMRLALERVTLLACAAALAAMAYAGVGSILKNRSTRTPTLDIPFWVFATPFLAGLVLAALGALWVALRRRDPPIGGDAPSL